MWGRGRPDGARATGPRPASTRWFAAPAPATPRSPSSTRISLLFLRLLRLRLRLRRLPGRPRARAHVDAIFRLPALARAGAGLAHSAPGGRGLRARSSCRRRCCGFASTAFKDPVLRDLVEKSFRALVVICKMGIFIPSRHQLLAALLFEEGVLIGPPPEKVAVIVKICSAWSSEVGMGSP